VDSLCSAGEGIPEDERTYFEPERVPPAVSKARRERESRLLAWRKEEAKRRGVDEQVVLPGHCVKDAVDGSVTDVEDLLRVPGIGAFRVNRDGAAIVSALRGDGVAAPAVQAEGALE
jgi:ribonuclease D